MGREAVPARMCHGKFRIEATSAIEYKYFPIEDKSAQVYILRIEAPSAIEYKFFPIEQKSAQVYIPRWQPNKKKTEETWPTEEDFNQQSEILKWRDLPKGIYKNHGHKEKQNNFGGSLILHLSTRENVDVFDVWAPQRLGDKILEEHYNFVFNEGLAKSTKTGYFYFKFSLL